MNEEPIYKVIIIKARHDSFLIKGPNFTCLSKSEACMGDVWCEILFKVVR